MLFSVEFLCFWFSHSCFRVIPSILLVRRNGIVEVGFYLWYWIIVLNFCSSQSTIVSWFSLGGMTHTFDEQFSLIRSLLIAFLEDYFLNFIVKSHYVFLLQLVSFLLFSSTCEGGQLFPRNAISAYWISNSINLSQLIYFPGTLSIYYFQLRDFPLCFYDFSL